MTKKVNNVGVYFGSFVPMHLGHLSVINRALRENDSIIVIVSGADKEYDRGFNNGFPLLKRYEYISEYFKENDRVIVSYLNEDNIPAMPNGWDDWVNLLQETIKTKLLNSPTKVNIYAGESIYITELSKRLTSTNFITYESTLVDRSEILVSGTMIRNDPEKYKEYVLPTYKEFFL